MTPTQEQQNLNNLLVELFQLDKTDLDFGIYRIMNIRAKDVRAFVDEQLPQQLNAVIKRLLKGNEADVAAEFEEVTKQLTTNFGVDPSDDAALQTVVGFPLGKKYIELRGKMRNQIDISKVEKAVYNDLYNFFSRYYEEGDFISMPRAGEKTYLIPYNGEEVKFHWANRDQYYIKTGENFKNYVFNNGVNPQAKTTIEFRLKEAETPLNNNQAKKGRIFIPFQSEKEDFFQWNAETRVATVFFEYKVPDANDVQRWGDKQTNKTSKGINEILVDELNTRIEQTKDAHLNKLWKEPKTPKNGNGKKETPPSNGAYHLNRYTSINAFDYFIHKRLGDFLKQELDFYIKNEVLSLAFLNADLASAQITESIERNIYRATAVRDAALHIIDFLAELEEFQKRLFEKKKFVVQADYCMTLDVIRNAVPNFITEFLSTEQRSVAQVNEWLKLGFIDTPSVITQDFLENNPFLVFDTQFMSADLKYRLLAAIPDIDEKTNGILFNSENWQALNFLENRFRNKIKSVYIDPPYNTAASEIIYKNDYKHSSWIALMQDRLLASKPLLVENGITCCTIDDFEESNLTMVMKETYTDFIGKVAIRIKPSGRPIPNGFAVSHEYALFATDSNETAISRLERDEEQMARYRETDNEGSFFWEMLRKAGSGSTRLDRPTMYFPFYIDDKNFVRIPKMEFNTQKQEYENIEEPFENEKTVYPKKDDGSSGRWYLGYEKLKTMPNDLKAVLQTNGDYFIYYKRRPNKGVQPTTIWVDAKYSATEHGTALIKKLFKEHNIFSYPKSIYAVEDCLKVSGLDEDSYALDFFAGSGTTAHAVINLNREDDGNRRYILVEMGEYFDTVTKPRVQKVIFSDKWKDGKPQADGKGISQIFQYIKLEQYEDTLNNIDTDQNTEGLLELLDLPNEKLRYWLHVQRNAVPLLEAQQQRNSVPLHMQGLYYKPFDSYLDVIRENERQETKVDLVTTFNYLLGIDVSRYYYEQHQERTYIIVTGKKRGQNYGIIWRNFDGLDLEIERHWIKTGAWWTSDALQYCNVDNAFGASNTEGELKRLMFDVSRNAVP